MGALPFVERPCKSIINRVRWDGMPFRWTINPYRGCSHACTYCYARVTHTYLDLGAGPLDPGLDFERVIVVKTNAAEALRRDLSRPGWRREVLAIGTATDPYQPAERTYRLTRQILEVLREFRQPCSITTKSPLILRDLDLLTELAAGAGCRVHVSVGTFDEAVWRVMEPGTASPRERLDAVAALSRAGVPAGVLLAPILPGLGDSEAQLAPLITAAAAAGARWASPIVLRLPDGARQWYLRTLGAVYPELLPLYRRLYARTNAPRRYVAAVEARVERLRRAAGVPGIPAGLEPAGLACATPDPVQPRLAFEGTGA